LQSIGNVLLSLNPQKDPITRTLEISFLYLHAPQWLNDLIQPVSFITVGAVVFTSTRGFLVSFAKLFRAVSAGVTTQSLALVLAYVMGSYFISTVLLMRMSMPEQYRSMLTRALGGVHFAFFHRWNDIVFITATIVTLISVVLQSTLTKPAALEVVDSRDKSA
jgi:golgi pH regulator